MQVQRISEPLKVQRLADGRRKLVQQLSYELVYKVNGERRSEIVDVPAGFQTDFSSDPIGLLDWSKVDMAGVVHDFLYRESTGRSRWREDVIWFKIATAGKWGSSRLTAGLGFLGIRLFGWLFRKHEPIVRRLLGLDAAVHAAAIVGLFWAVIAYSAYLDRAALAAVVLRTAMVLYRSFQRKAMQVVDDD